MRSESSKFESIGGFFHKFTLDLTYAAFDSAIDFYRQSINVIESIRKDNRSLSPDLQASYIKSVSETYQELADLLVSRGRNDEAQKVLKLLELNANQACNQRPLAGGDRKSICYGIHAAGLIMTNIRFIVAQSRRIPEIGTGFAVGIDAGDEDGFIAA